MKVNTINKIINEIEEKLDMLKMLGVTDYRFQYDPEPLDEEDEHYFENGYMVNMPYVKEDDSSGKWDKMHDEIIEKAGKDYNILRSFSKNTTGILFYEKEPKKLNK